MTMIFRFFIVDLVRYTPMTHIYKKCIYQPSACLAATDSASAVRKKIKPKLNQLKLNQSRLNQLNLAAQPSILNIRIFNCKFTKVKMSSLEFSFSRLNLKISYLVLELLLG